METVFTCPLGIVTRLNPLSLLIGLSHDLGLFGVSHVNLYNLISIHIAGVFHINRHRDFIVGGYVGFANVKLL